MDHRTRLGARREVECIRIGTVGINFVDRRQPERFRGPRGGRPRHHHEGKFRIDGLDGAADGKRHFIVIGTDIAERAMGFHMCHRMVLKCCDRSQRPDLISHQRFHFGDDQSRQTPTTKTDQVHVAGMRADCDATFLRQPHRLAHDVRVTGMEPAGNVGGADDIKHRRVVTHRPRAKTLAEIGIEIDAHDFPFLVLRRFSAVQTDA